MDKYDEQVEYLTRHPYNIFQHWVDGKGIFSIINEIDHIPDAGCLTMIRNNLDSYAYIGGKRNVELTNKIRADERIPKKDWNIIPANLPAFVEWRRRIDKIIEDNKKVSV